MNHPHFSFERSLLNLASFNPKSVQHGNERGSLADLRFVMQGTSADLAMLHQNLRQTLYTKSDAIGIDKDADILTVLRFPQLQTIKWEYEQVGSDFTIHYGVRDDGDIHLTECQVDKIKFTPQEGAIVGFAFRIRCRPTEQQAGKIYEMIKTDLVCSLSPPAQKELALQKSA